ncbi:MAG: hypothetical protein Q9159_003289 [Coniocarpon cinnabarinum]
MPKSKFAYSMAKEDYSGIVGGGLKFKGDGVKKKKKKHTSMLKDEEKAEGVSKAIAQVEADDDEAKQKAKDDETSGTAKSADQLKEMQESLMTESERAFARAKRDRMLKGDKNMSLKSYEERKQLFAKSLAEAPEHNDMPKVGPG